jgi:dipeptidase D
MRVFENLEPKEVFYYFEDICGIPHGSGNVQKISDYCVEFAKKHQLEYRQEENGNVIIRKPATPGYEQADTVILQGHIDMVAVKDDDCDIDLEHDGLRVAVDGDWVYAKGTSLGGDDGIAVAYALAILASSEIAHPALEVVLTVDEEIGLLGATALQADDLKGKILMNMDSEDDGIFLISCAGGATVECIVPAPEVLCEGVVYDWKLDGLCGGHSGMEIQKGRANANVVFGRYLMEVGEKVALHAGSIAGGEKDNAIAKICRSVIVVPAEQAEAFEKATAEFAAVLKNEYAQTEPDFALTVTRRSETSAPVLTDEAQNKLTQLLVHLPAGVQKMMAGVPNMVQTSLNMGILKLENKEASMTFSVRSAVDSEKEWLIKQMVSLTELVGGHCNISGVYPGWEYQPDSRIRPLMAQTYEELTGKKPVLEAIHAGVECGIFCKKIPGLDCISYGPQMEDIHTTRERLCISSVKRNWEVTLEVLKRLK